MPAPGEADRLAERGARLCEQLGLAVRWRVRPQRLHVTLQHLGRHAEPPPALVEAACRAAAGVALAPLEIRFDRARGFGAGRAALALCAGRDDNAPVRALKADLDRRLAAAGVASPSRFDPHLTVAWLARGGPALELEPFAFPVAWLALLLSRAGHGQYDTLASWPLPAHP